jgi:hypothetical protein
MDQEKMNLNEIKELLRQSEADNKEKEEQKRLMPKKLKEIRKGIIVFAIVHLLFEIALAITIYKEHSKVMLLSVIVNYSVSYFYVKNRLEKNLISENSNLMNYGIKVSFIVFLFRLAVGFIQFFVFK